jgi:hypothetical protein
MPQKTINDFLIQKNLMERFDRSGQTNKVLKSNNMACG